MSYSLAFSQAVALITYVAFKIEHRDYEFVPTKDIAEALNVAGPTAVKLLQSLSRAGIIETREGAKGGVRLARAPDTITLLDVFHAIEQDRPLFRFDLKLRLADQHVQPVQQRIRAVINRAEDAMKAELRATTVAHLVAQAD
jgi:Rrf2 family protein